MGQPNARSQGYRPPNQGASKQAAPNRQWGVKEDRVFVNVKYDLNALEKRELAANLPTVSELWDRIERFVGDGHTFKVSYDTTNDSYICGLSLALVDGFTHYLQGRGATPFNAAVSAYFKLDSVMAGRPDTFANQNDGTFG